MGCIDGEYLDKSWSSFLVVFFKVDFKMRFYVNVIYQKVFLGKNGWEVGIGLGKEGGYLRV